MGFFDFFPYTNFHNVNLDWVLQRVKEWGELVEANDTAFHDLEEANASFKLYVENYLAALDVQAQIDDKLDRMFESGELTEYLQPYISNDVTTWLEEHITEPTGVVIDSSLTVSGACADAKAVGDELTILKAQVLTDTVKNAILNCFKHVAFYGSDREPYEELESALIGDVFFNTWRWVLNENVIMLRGGIDPQTTAPSRLTISAITSTNYNRRRTIVVTQGKEVIYQTVDSSTVVPTIYYPLPIPRTARHMKISMQPFGQDIFVHTVPFDVESATYGNTVEENRIAWTTLVNGFIEKDLTQVDGKQLFLIANFRYSSSAQNYPIEPQEIIVEFS